MEVLNIEILMLRDCMDKSPEQVSKLILWKHASQNIYRKSMRALLLTLLATKESLSMLLLALL